MEINIEQIEELIASDITSDQIQKETGVSNKTIDKYKKGSSINSMSLATAKKLMEFINGNLEI